MEKLSKNELIEICKKGNIKGVSNKSKEEIIQIIRISENINSIKSNIEGYYHFLVDSYNDRRKFRKGHLIELKYQIDEAKDIYNKIKNINNKDSIREKIISERNRLLIKSNGKTINEQKKNEYLNKVYTLNRVLISIEYYY